MLRDYQQRSIDMLYSWIENNKGHPCVVMPTGSGKSHVIAALCKDALQTWPETRILMLTHVKELIEQNAEKMRLHWPGAPLGIYSASVGKRQLGEPITFAGIQSVRDKAKQIGTFLKTADGYKVTEQEGFVAIDHMGKNAVKLVDRLQFSHANFSADIQKGWQR